MTPLSALWFAGVLILAIFVIFGWISVLIPILFGGTRPSRERLRNLAVFTVVLLIVGLIGISTGLAPTF